MTLAQILGGVQKVVTTGSDAYTTVRSLKEGPAPVAAPEPTVGGSFAPPPATAPWYRAKWVIPAGVALAGIVLVSVLRGRR